MEFRSNDFTSLKQDVASLNNTVSQICDKLDDQAVVLQEIVSLVSHGKEESCSKPHPCGNAEEWRRVAYLDMTDPTTTCPAGWVRNTNYPRRTCGRKSSGPLSCDPVVFSVGNGNYTKICGQIRAYQYGGPDGFESYNSGQCTSLDCAYVSGVSVTTNSTSRTHIWTFAAGISEGDSDAPDICPCDIINHTNNRITVPDFVDNDYFCESGINELWDRSKHWGSFMSNDYLWDGQNCLTTSKCCSNNNPPVFFKHLPNTTYESIEIRICLLDGKVDSDIAIEQLELYVQ